MPDGSDTKISGGTTQKGPVNCGQIRRGRKFDQVLRGAREVFLGAGFEGANVDEIARAAGVSKATLYSYFPDKRLLFLEVVRTECTRQANSVVETIDRAAPVAEVLLTAARHIIDLVLSPFGQRSHRTLIGEADRFPEMAREFYDSGPGLGRNMLSAYLADAAGRGLLVGDDWDFAADQFQALCKAGLHDRAMFQIETDPTPAARARAADEAVTTFLARYGA